MVAERNTRKLLDGRSTPCCSVTSRALATYKPSSQRRRHAILAILGSAGRTATATGSRRAPSGIDPASRSTAGNVRRAYRIAGEMPVDGIGDELDRYAVVPQRVIQLIGLRDRDPRVAHIRQDQRGGQAEDGIRDR